MNPIIVIPSRMASTRLPGKPLADIHGRAMILHVLDRAREADIGPVAVACSEEEVALAIREAGGIALEFPVHPIQETGKRPTAGLDRNLAYLGLVEALFGYPLDGVVLTTGCDKTTPALLMAAAPVNLPAGHYGLGNGYGAHAPDEYYLIDSANPKVQGLDGAVASFVEYLYALA